MTTSRPPTGHAARTTRTPLPGAEDEHGLGATLDPAVERAWASWWRTLRLAFFVRPVADQLRDAFLAGRASASASASASTEAPATRR
jgi:hypothetical protein